MVTAFLDWLSTATKYLFLFRFFEQKIVECFLKICYPLLSVDSDEEEEFKDNGEAFILITEEMVEIGF